MTSPLQQELSRLKQNIKIQNMVDGKCPICNFEISYRHKYDCTFDRLKGDGALNLISALEVAVNALDAYNRFYTQGGRSTDGTKAGIALDKITKLIVDDK